MVVNDGDDHLVHAQVCLAAVVGHTARSCAFGRRRHGREVRAAYVAEGGDAACAVSEHGGEFHAQVLVLALHLHHDDDAYATTQFMAVDGHHVEQLDVSGS